MFAALVPPAKATTLNGIIDQQFPAGAANGKPLDESKTGNKSILMTDVVPSGFCMVQSIVFCVVEDALETWTINNPLLFIDGFPPLYFFNFLYDLILVQWEKLYWCVPRIGYTHIS